MATRRRLPEDLRALAAALKAQVIERGFNKSDLTAEINNPAPEPKRRGAPEKPDTPALLRAMLMEKERGKGFNAASRAVTGEKSGRDAIADRLRRAYRRYERLESTHSVAAEMVVMALLYEGLVRYGLQKKADVDPSTVEKVYGLAFYCLKRTDNADGRRTRKSIEFSRLVETVEQVWSAMNALPDEVLRFAWDHVDRCFEHVERMRGNK
jgi:hypothetical protein